jgi:GNAT superfamily N-acetyltransferase
LTLVLEPLAAQHDRSAFSCGEPALDEWLQRRVGQDERRNVARVFVAVDRALGVVGFYSLSSFILDLTDLPDAIARSLPRYNLVPAALIGRLAQDQQMRGKDLGGLLLADAVRRVLSASRSLAIFAIVVDAKDERAAQFYAGFGFRRFPLHPGRLFLLVPEAASAMERI